MYNFAVVINEHPNSMKIGIIQQRCGEDIEKNIAHLEQGARQATQQGAELIVMQELHN